MSGKEAFTEALRRIQEGEFGEFNNRLIKAVNDNFNELQAVYD